MANKMDDRRQAEKWLVPSKGNAASEGGSNDCAVKEARGKL
jgi:hypothetical protein